MITNTPFQIFGVSAHDLPANMLDVLINIRQEWELTTDGRSLLYCQGSVGLLLFDIVTKLDIPLDEQRRILGSVLFDEMTEFVTRHG